MTSPKIDEFWDNKASVLDSYAGKGFLHYEYNLRQKLLQGFVKIYSPNAKDYSILDLGCGTGLSLSIFGPMFNRSYGIDISKEMVEKSIVNCPFSVIKNIDFKSFNMKVNYITALTVLEYFNNPSDLFEKSKDILESPSILIFSFNKNDTLFSKIEKYYRKLKRYLFPNKVHSLNTSYKRSEILKLCKQNNFRILEVYDYGFHSNIFSLGLLKYIYPIFQILLEKIIFINYLREKISTNTIIVCSYKKS